MTGPEAQKTGRKGKGGGSKDTTASSSTMQGLGPVAPSCLPGLYKTKQLPSIVAEDLSVSTSSESDGPVASLSKACKASAKHPLGGVAALAGRRASLKQTLEQRVNEHGRGVAISMQRQAKRPGRQSLPGRLRKKLAKEEGKGGGVPCKHN